MTSLPEQLQLWVSTTRALFRVRSSTTSQMDHLPASRSTDVSSVGGSQTDTMSDAPLLKDSCGPEVLYTTEHPSGRADVHAEPTQISAQRCSRIVTRSEPRHHDHRLTVAARRDRQPRLPKHQASERPQRPDMFSQVERYRNPRSCNPHGTAPHPGTRMPNETACKSIQ